MIRVLVTGATGFIGRHALPMLVLAGAEVHAVARRPGRSMAGVNWHQADLLRAEDRAQLIQTVRPTHLLHFAWIAEHGRFWEAEENSAWLDASRDLVRRFRDIGGGRVVGAGSCAEYDWQDPALAAGGLCDEHGTPCRPATLYGRCKLAMSDWLRMQPGLSHAWGRIFFTYGDDEDRRRLVPAVITALLTDQPAEIGPGTQVRDFLDVRDVAAAFVAMLTAPVEGVVNIGAGAGVTVADLAREIAQLVGKPDLLRVGALPARPGDPPFLVPNIDRLRIEAGFRPARDRTTGLVDTIAWWQRHAEETAG